MGECSLWREHSPKDGVPVHDKHQVLYMPVFLVRNSTAVVSRSYAGSVRRACMTRARVN